MTTPMKAIAGLNGTTYEEMTDAEVADFATSQTSAVLAEDTNTLRLQAKMALSESDLTVLRCIESGTAIPSTWAIYRSELRTIVSSGMGTIPTRPTYPV